MWDGSVRVLVAGLLCAASSASAGTDASLGPLIAGTHSYVSGTFVATDYAYDDQGPARDETPGGDAVYPEGLENAADLIQLQIGLDGGLIEITAILETLVDPKLPLVGIGFDTDADPATGAAAFPGGEFVPQTPLGIELFVRLSKASSELLHFADGHWARHARLDGEVDVEANTLRTAFPRNHFEPGDATWRAFAAVGLATRRESWLDGKGPIFDLAFVGNESPAYAIRFQTGRAAWQDRKQSEVLAGTLDPAEATALIDWKRIVNGVTELAEAKTPGMHTLLYHSKLELGEGISPFPDTALEGTHDLRRLHRLYKGPYQPYVLWLPERTPLPAPLIVLMHGTGSTHLSAMSRGWFGPGRLHPRAAVVQPLGRGEATGYFGVAEQDIFDVIADITARMPIDEDRVVLTGWSAGGMGALRLGQLRPDRFTALVPLVGHSRQEKWVEHIISGGEYFLPHALENLYSVPVRSISGRLDDSKADDGPDRDELDLYAMGYDYRHWLLFRRGHEVVPELVNSALVEAISRPRVIDPARVVFTVEPYLEKSDPDTGLALRYDGAYWASGIRVRGGPFERGDRGTIDVVSLARADRNRTTTRISEYGVSRRADLLGPNRFVSTNDRWVTRGLVVEPGTGAPTSNGLRATLEGVAELTLDLERMQLRADRELALEVTGDGATRLHLLGVWSDGASLWRDGERHSAPERGTDGITISEDFAGRHHFVLRPVSRQ